VTKGAWHHVAVTNTGGLMQLYLDGIAVGSPVEMKPNITVGQINIGSKNDATNAFKGQIADVRMWNDARTASEILNNKDARLAGTEADLVGYWRLDEGAGTSAEDSSQNSNTGTLTNGPVWSYDAPGVADTTLTVLEDGSFTGRIIAHDAEQEAFTFSKAADPTNGTLTVNADGSFTYTPNANYSGADSFQVTTTETTTANAQQSTTTTINVTVTAVNDAPLVAASRGETVVHKTTTSTIVDPNIAITDVDDTAAGTLTGGTLKIAIASNQESGDRLELVVGNTMTLSNGTNAGSQVSVGGVVMGTVNATNNGETNETLIVDLNAAATIAGVQAIARQIGYRSAAPEPGALPRTVTFEVNDGTDTNATETTVIDTNFLNNSTGTGIIPATYTKTQSDGSTATITNNASVGNGVLRLTEAIDNRQGLFLVDPPAAVAGQKDFKASFKLKIGDNATTDAQKLLADGMTFGFGKAAFDESVGTTADAEEEGLDTGLSVTFDTWDNATQEESFGGQSTFGRIEVKYDGTVIAVSDPLDLANDRTNAAVDSFVDVVIEHTDAGLVVQYAGNTVIDNIDIPSYAPQTDWSWLFAARTGGENADHYIDDLKITVPEVEVGNTLYSSTRTLEIDTDGVLSDTFDKSVSTKAFRFDGTTDLITIDTNPSGVASGTGPLTLEAWIKPNSITSGQRYEIFSLYSGNSNNTGAFMWVDADGTVRYDTFGGPDLISEYRVDDGQWHHVAMTHDGTTGSLYVDGVLHSQQTFAQNVTHDRFRIGANNNHDNHFNGDIADIRIWHSTRTAGDIAANMEPSNTSILDDDGIVAVYRATNASTTAGAQTVTDLAQDASINHAVLGTNDTVGTGDPALVDVTIGLINTSKWVVMDSDGSGTANPNDNSIVAENGNAVLRNREWLRTKDTFEPEADAPVHVTGSFTFTGATSDILSIFTRATTAGTQEQYGRPSNSIEFFLDQATGNLRIDKTVAGTVTNIALTQNDSITFTKNTEYTFEVFDDGTNVRMHVFEASNPSNGAVISGSDAFDPAGDEFVVIANREDTGSDHTVNLHEIAIDRDGMTFEGTAHTGKLDAGSLTGTLTFTTPTAANGTISGFDAATGAYTYTPNTEYHGQDTIAYTVTSASGGLHTQTARINVIADADQQASGDRLSFDGVNDYAALPDSASLTFSDAFTIEAWTKINGGSGTQTLMAQGSVFALNVTAAGVLQFTTAAGTQITGTAAVNSGWHHVAMTYENGIYKLMVDGQVDAQAAGAAPAVSTAAYTVGGIPGTGNYLNGNVDELRIWSIARSEDDIRLNHNQAVSSSESGLKAYYTFEAVKDGVVQDKTSNNNDLSLGDVAQIGNEIEPTVVDADGIDPIINTATLEVLESQAISGTMSKDSLLEGTVSYSVLDLSGNPQTSYTLLNPNAGNSDPLGTLAINSGTGAWTFTPVNGYAGDVSFTLRAKGATSGSVDEAVTFTVVQDVDASVNVAGGVLDVSGTDDVLRIANHNDLDLTGSQTFEAWAKSETGPTAGFHALATDWVTGSLVHWFGFENTTGTLVLFLGDSDGFSKFGSSITLEANVWHHYAVSVDTTAQTVTFYRDGSAVGSPIAFSAATSSPYNGTRNVSNNETIIGGKNDGGVISDEFQGQIDDVRIWGDARTATEIRDNFDQQLAGSEDNLVAYYKFDDNGDAATVTVTDSAGTAQNGTLNSDAAMMADRGGAMSFDGTNDKITMADSTSFDAISTGNAITVESWINLGRANHSDFQTILSQWNGAESNFSFRVNPTTNKLDLTFANDANTIAYAFTSDITVPANEWMHVAATVDPTTKVVSFFANGDLIGNPISYASIGWNGDIAPSTSDVAIGALAQNVHYYQGQVDDVRVWSTARTPQQIKDHYDQALTGAETGLIANYAFDEPSGNAIDKTANGNDGTINGATRVADHDIGGNTLTVSENDTASGIYTANDVLGTPMYSITDTSATNDVATANGVSTFTTDKGGVVRIDAATGAWTYDPAENFYGTDSFTLGSVGAGNTAQTDSEVITVTVQQDASIASNTFPSDGGVLDVPGTADGRASATIGEGQITNALSLQARVSFDVLTGQQNFLALRVANGDNVVVYKTTDHKLGFYVEDHSALPAISGISEFVVSANTWYDISATFDAATGAARLYVNGKAVFGGTQANVAFTGDADVVIGGNHPLEVQGFDANAKVDEVKVWSKVLTPAEVLSTYGQAATGTETGLAAYYTFDQKTDDITVENKASGSLASDLTLAGATNVVATPAGTPALFDSVIETTQGEAATGTFTANDVRDTGTGSVTYSIVGGATTTGGGTITIDASSGVWSYTPTAAYVGPDTFQVRATGANNTVDTETITVKVFDNDGVNVAAKVLQLDGVNDFVDLPDDTGLLSATTGTVELRFNFNDAAFASTDTAAHFMFANTATSGGDRVYIYVAQTGSGTGIWEARAIMDDGDSILLGKIKPGEWNHAAITWDSSGNGHSYLNGEQGEAKTSLSYTSAGIDNLISIGTLSDNGSSGQLFAGQIDEVRIWNTTRTAEQIDIFKDQQITGNEGGALVGNYRFDDSTSDNTVTNVANAGTNDGTYTNGASTAPFLGGAVSFDGENASQITIAADSSLQSASGTWSIWVKSDLDWDTGNADTGNSASLLGLHDTSTSNNGPHLYVLSDGRIQADVKNNSGTVGTATSTTTIADGKWHQVTFSYDKTLGSVQKIYVDGTLAASGISTAVWDYNGTTAPTFTAGNSVNAFWEEFKGEIGDVRLYNTQLTDAQVRDQFATPPDPGAANLIGLYTFDEASGTTISNDATAAGKAPDGALAGGVTRIEASPDTFGASFNILEDQTVSGTMDTADSYATGTAPTKGAVTLDAVTGAWAYKPQTNFVGTDTFQLSRTTDGTTITETISVIVADDGTTATANTVSSGNILQIDGGTSSRAIADLTEIPLGSSFSFQTRVNFTDLTGQQNFLHMTAGGTGDLLILYKQASTGGTISSGGNNTLALYGADTGTGVASANTVTAVTADTWYDLTGTYDGTMLKIYVEGTLVGETAIANIDFSGGATLTIGGNPIAVAGGDSKVLVDDVKVWSKALTSTEILNGLGKAATGAETDLVAAYAFDRLTTEGVIENQAGSDVDLTLSGAAALTANPAGLPTLYDATIETNLSTAVSGTMTANDVHDTGSVAYSLVGGTTTTGGGTVSIDSATGAWTYTPTATYVGGDTFQVRATGANGTVDTETITVKVFDDDAVNVSSGFAQLDGNNARIDIDGNLLNPTQGTLELRFNFNDTGLSTSEPHYIFGNGPTSTNDQLHIAMVRDGSVWDLRVTLDSGTVLDLGPVPTDSWHHVALSWNSTGTAHAYLDGDLGGTATDVTFSTGMRSNASVGQLNRSTSDDKDFQGQIDDVRIWNVARDGGDIDVFKDQQLTGSESGLVGYYTFDDPDSDNSATNSVSGGAAATYQQGANAAPFLGGAVSLDGASTSNVTIAADADLRSTTGTWSVWMKTDGDWLTDGTDPNNAVTLMNMHSGTTSLNGVGLTLTSAGLPTLEVKNGSGTVANTSGTTSIADGDWHQVTVTWDQSSGSLQRLFVDGVMVGSAHTSGAWSFATSPLMIGDSPDAFWEEFRGEIADVRIYNTGLTDGQVAADFATAPKPDAANLVGHYTFDEATGTTATNLSTNTNVAGDATLNGVGATRVDASPDTYGNAVVVNENESISGDLIAADSYAKTDGTNGTVVVDATGTWTYTPTANYAGNDSFTLSRTVGGVTTTETVTVTVTAVAATGNVAAAQQFISLDGTDDYIALGAQSALDGLTNRFTVEAWVNPRAAGESGRILASGRESGQNGFALTLTNGKPSFTTLGVHDYVNARFPALTVGEWSHVAAVMDANNDVTFYVNGEAVGTIDHNAPAIANSTTSADPWYIGATTTSGTATQTEFLNGSVDEVRVWSEARTAEQIRDNHDQAIDGTLPTTLKGYWQFNDTGASGVIAATVGNAGTLQGGAKLVPDMGKAINISGVSASVGGIDKGQGDNLFIQGDLTLETWFMSENLPGSGTFDYLMRMGTNFAVGSQHNDQYALRINSGGDIVYRHQRGNLNGEAITFDTNLSTKEWHHLSLVRDAADMTVTLYVDGKSFGSQALSSLPTGGTSSDVKFTLGGETDTGASLSGQIADARVWNTTRTAEQIAETYRSPVVSNADGLVSHWAFEEASGATINDSVGDNNGTLNQGNGSTPYTNVVRVDVGATIKGTAFTVDEGHAITGVMDGGEVNGTPSFVVLDGSNAEQASYTVTNQGTVTVDATTGRWTFTPVEGFHGAVSLPYAPRATAPSLITKPSR